MAPERFDRSHYHSAGLASCQYFVKKVSPDGQIGVQPRAAAKSRKDVRRRLAALSKPRYDNGSALFRRRLTSLERFLKIGLPDGRELDLRPGQFVQVSITGAGKAPISISSSRISPVPTGRGAPVPPPRRSPYNPDLSVRLFELDIEDAAAAQKKSPRPAPWHRGRSGLSRRD